MARTSLYISEEAAVRLAAAVDKIVTALGGDIPKHVATSALIINGVESTSEVISQLANARAADLAAQLQALQHVR